MNIDTNKNKMYNVGMNKVCRKLSTNFLDELNIKFEYNEVIDFLNYAKSFYEDLNIIERFYKEDFNKISPLSINRYKIIFDNVYNKIVERIFDENITESIRKDKSGFMLKHGRFNLENMIALNSKNVAESTKFKNKRYKKLDFNFINEYAEKLFALEVKCSKYTKQFWNTGENLNLEDGLFVKIITKENWRDKKLTPSLKNYYNSRVGLSVSFINDKKSKFFRDSCLDVLAGIVYKPEKIICGNYFDCYTSEFIDGKNPIDNLSFKFSGVNKIYSEKINGKTHDIYAFATLTATPLGVLSSDDLHNEIIVDKNSAKPVAVFYLNEKSKQYASELAKQQNLPIIKLESINKLNKYRIVNTQHVLQEKIHF